MHRLATCLIGAIAVLAAAVEPPDTGWVDPDVAPLVTPFAREVGTAVVWNDADAIRLRLSVDPGWEILAVASACGDSPEDFEPGVEPPRGDLLLLPEPQPSCDLEISIAGGPGVGEEYQLAAELLLVRRGRRGRFRGFRLAALDGVRLRWLRLHGYVVDQWWPKLDLPAGPVTFKGHHPGPDSYWEHELLDVPPGGIEPGFYPAWCVQKEETMRENHLYEATLRNPFDPDLPAPFADQPWDQINYLLNHRPAGLSWQDSQDAIWLLLGKIGEEDASEAARDAAAAARADGDGYMPQPGEDVGVIVDTPPKVQDTLMVETVDPPPPPSGNG